RTALLSKYILDANLSLRLRLDWDWEGRSKHKSLNHSMHPLPPSRISKFEKAVQEQLAISPQSSYKDVSAAIQLALSHTAI
ncbi:S-locus lectin protein kinase family protein, partial [Prunus dulcis]